jgi:hypothetical protein
MKSGKVGDEEGERRVGREGDGGRKSGKQGKIGRVGDGGKRLEARGLGREGCGGKIGRRGKLGRLGD